MKRPNQPFDRLRASRPEYVRLRSRRVPAELVQKWSDLSNQATWVEPRGLSSKALVNERG